MAFITWMKSKRWTMLAIMAFLLIGIAVYTRSWYGAYRDWHIRNSAPLFAEIEPTDGATVYGADVWIRWKSAGTPKGRVVWRKAGALRVQSADAGNGQELLAHLAPLNPGSKYEYIVEENDGSRILRDQRSKT